MNSPVLPEPPVTGSPAEATVPEERLNITVDRADPGHATVRVTGDIDLVTAGTLHKRLHALLSTAGTTVVLDLTGVSFLGSAGLSELVVAAKLAATTGVALLLVANSRTVLRPLEITGLLSLFQIYGSEQEAARHV